MLDMLLKLARPAVKQQIKTLIKKYEGYAPDRPSTMILKKYVTDIFNEVIEEHLQEKNL